MKAQAQVVDLNQYRERRGGGRPCGGKLYSLFHSDNFKGNSNKVLIFVPPGYKYCKKRGLVKIKQEVPEQKKENQENIDDLAFQKKETKKEDSEQNPEIKKEDELSRIVKNDYTMMQREIMQEINQYRKVQNYEELNKNRKIIPIKEQGVCPLCGSKTNQKSEEEVYSKAA